jgi:glycosyltransferase involved in cell wall biosynthesis
MSVNGEACPRVLLMPNEGMIGDQPGVRSTFNELYQEGRIGALETFSFLPNLKKDGIPHRSHHELLSLSRAFRPDIIFWQHPLGYPLDPKFLAELRRQSGNPLIAYHEADPYDPIYKRVTYTEKSLYLASDIFLTSALGLQREVFQRIRPHPELYYLPSAVERERFAGAPIIERSVVPLDCMLIGSIAYRFRVLKHPGSAERVRLARELTRALGARFVVYGSRWPDGSNCMGRIAYDQQASALRTAKCSVIWEHFPGNSFYFSDRLPIAMASGTPFVICRRPGYHSMLGDAPGLLFADTVREAVDAVLYLRSLSETRLCELGRSARQWMLENLEARPVFRRAFEICVDVWRRRQVRREVPQS